jgi:hypothetical protein
LSDYLLAVDGAEGFGRRQDVFGRRFSGKLRGKYSGDQHSEGDKQHQDPGP